MRFAWIIILFFLIAITLDNVLAQEIHSPRMNIKPTDMKRGSIFLLKEPFEQGSSVLSQTNQEYLNVFVEAFSMYEALRVEITGHTDYRGNAKMNLKLSKDRANAVKNYLTSKGVSKKKVSSIGYGGKYPIFISKDPFSYKLNRRVEITVIDNPSLPANFYRLSKQNVDTTAIDKINITNEAQMTLVGKKLALVVGNNNYENLSQLSNPINDANLMESTLSNLGFEVFRYDNLTHMEMMTSLRDFSVELNDSDVVFFYFAGHGLQHNGQNYLLPIDAKLKNGSADLQFEAINTDLIFKLMEYTNKESLNIMILDACRNNPFPNSTTRSTGTGLAEMKAPTGSIIAFATSPGAVAFDGDGNNGVYTEELAKQLMVSQRVEDVFMNTRIAVEKRTNDQQSPWELFRLRGVFYFK